MAIITNNNSPKTLITIELKRTIVQKIMCYCKWASIETIDSFIEKAASYIFLKDKSRCNNITFTEHYRRVVLKKKPRKTHAYAYKYVRTKPDAFEHVWENIVLELEINPTLTPRYFLTKLIKSNPKKFRLTQQRTLTRRIKNWRELPTNTGNFPLLAPQTPLQLALSALLQRHFDGFLTDEHWNKITKVLSEIERNTRNKAKNNRLFFEAVIYRYREKIAWAKLPAPFGSFVNIAARHNKWLKQGIWNQIFQALESDCEN